VGYKSLPNIFFDYPSIASELFLADLGPNMKMKDLNARHRPEDDAFLPHDEPDQTGSVDEEKRESIQEEDDKMQTIHKILIKKLVFIQPLNLMRHTHYIR